MARVRSAGADVVSPYTGLVAYSHPMAFTPDAIPDALHSARTADTGFLTGIASEGFSMGPGGGAAQARMSCVGEAVERLSLAGARGGFRAPLGADARQVEPDAFQRFHPTQREDPSFPFERAERGDLLTWFPARSLQGAREAHVPAQMVVFDAPHGPDGHREAHLEPATSSGVAAGPTFAFAAGRAILELIERDAFQRTWLRGSTPAAFDWRSSPRLADATLRELARLEELCGRFGAAFTLRVLDAAADVPVLLAVMRSDRIGVAVGCAADFRLDRAALNAVREALHTHNWCLRLLPDPPIAPAEVVEFEDHVRLHCRPDARSLSAALDASGERVASVGGPSSWAEVVAGLHREGIEVLLADITAPEVRAAGFHVVRALSSDLVALDVRHDARFLGHPRLYRRWRDGPAREGPDDLVDVPHPFP
ncbi:YcaO-like family protein [Clavibacter michiganensis subsp. phaseoli]|uniref:YcaO-like family protein n=1 Tax=Clavibacter phaseoli TaxID=1734031 RepID=UPI001FB3CFEB|nr:YcaO-like family protein [Clavibacter phaseoli]MCJ1711707.1 YcaO-like family protein [Clavibacter phaseoli]